MIPSREFVKFKIEPRNIQLCVAVLEESLRGSTRPKQAFKNFPAVRCAKLRVFNEIKFISGERVREA